jgi:hypothetical protein
MSGAGVPAEAVAFVNPARRLRWEEDHRLVQHADLRDHCAKIFHDAIKATGGL